MQQSPIILDFCLKKTQSGNSWDCRDATVFVKLPFQNDFRPHKDEKLIFFSSGLESVSKKLRFRDGLMWTVGLTVEIKLCFQISPAVDVAKVY